jgi:hypothetical protein
VPGAIAPVRPTDDPLIAAANDALDVAGETTKTGLLRRLQKLPTCSVAGTL